MWDRARTIRPLARTRDEHDRFILALLSLDRSRFFVSQIGQVEEVLEVRGERAVPKPEATRNEARVLARAESRRVGRGRYA